MPLRSSKILNMVNNVNRNTNNNNNKSKINIGRNNHNDLYHVKCNINILNYFSVNCN